MLKHPSNTKPYCVYNKSAAARAAPAALVAPLAAPAALAASAVPAASVYVQHGILSAQGSFCSLFSDICL